MRALIIAVGGVAIILMGATGAIQLATQEATLESQPTLNDSETFAVTEGTTHDFAQSNQDGVVYVGADDVDVSQNNVSIASNDGENWDWRRGTGTLFVPNGSDLNESQDATISYSFAEQTNPQELNEDVGLLAPSMGDSIMAIGGVSMLLGASVVLARIGGM